MSTALVVLLRLADVRKISRGNGLKSGVFYLLLNLIDIGGFPTPVASVMTPEPREASAPIPFDSRLLTGTCKPVAQSSFTPALTSLTKCPFLLKSIHIFSHSIHSLAMDFEIFELLSNQILYCRS